MKEIIIKVPTQEGLEIVSAEVLDNDQIKVQIGTLEEAKFERIFPVVNPASLSLTDSFLQQWTPTTDEEKIVKENITSAIKDGMPPFRVPVIEARESENVKGPVLTFTGGIHRGAHSNYRCRDIAYIQEECAQQLMPEKHSRLGTADRFDVWSAIIAKHLVEEQNWGIKSAWETVIYQRRALRSLWGKINKSPYYDGGVPCYTVADYNGRGIIYSGCRVENGYRECNYIKPGRDDDFCGFNAGTKFWCTRLPFVVLDV